jgi:hypothetical protein
MSYAQSELHARGQAEISTARAESSPDGLFVQRESGSFVLTCSVLIRRMFVNLMRSANGIKIRLFQMLLFAFLLWAYMGRLGLSTWRHFSFVQHRVQGTTRPRCRTAWDTCMRVSPVGSVCLH